MDRGTHPVGQCRVSKQHNSVKKMYHSRRPRQHETVTQQSNSGREKFPQIHVQHTMTVGSCRYLCSPKKKTESWTIHSCFIIGKSCHKYHFCHDKTFVMTKVVTRISHKEQRSTKKKKEEDSYSTLH